MRTYDPCQVFKIGGEEHIFHEGTVMRVKCFLGFHEWWFIGSKRYCHHCRARQRRKFHGKVIIWEKLK